MRQQLTLFIPPEQAQTIEALRARYNPLQKALIDSHVTLCREDELSDLEAVSERLQQLDFPVITIPFGAAERFENGKGVWLPAQGNLEPYYALRAAILGSEKAALKRPLPHITLLHPRNATCDDEIFEHFRQAALPGSITFNTVSLIQQENGGPWQILQSFALRP